MKTLKYFVYTSGESHGGQVDWAAKFASPAFPLVYQSISQNQPTDSRSHEFLVNLSNAYTDQVQRFGLSGGLQICRANGNELGYILLPWNEDYCLAGIYANFADLQRRPNIGLVMAAVPTALQKEMTPARVLAKIQSANEIEKIARPRGTEEQQEANPDIRPSALNLETPQADQTGIAEISGLKNVNWPGKDQLVIFVNGKVEKLTAQHEAKPQPQPAEVAPQPEKSGIGKKIVLAVALLCVISFGVHQWMNDREQAKLENARIELEKAQEAQRKAQEEQQRRLAAEQTANEIVEKGLRGINGAVTVFTARGVEGSPAKYTNRGVLYSASPNANLKAPDGEFAVSNTSVGKNEILLNMGEVERKLKGLFNKKLVVSEISSQMAISRSEWKEKVADFEKALRGVDSAADIKNAPVGIAEDQKQTLKKEVFASLSKPSDGELFFAFLYSPQQGKRAIRFISLDGSVRDRAFDSMPGYVSVKSSDLNRWLKRLTEKSNDGLWVDSGESAITLFSSKGNPKSTDAFIKEFLEKLSDQ